MHKLMLSLGQPPESYAQRVKPEFYKLHKHQSQLNDDIDSILESDDFMEFSHLIDPVIEYHDTVKSWLKGWTIFLKSRW